MQKCYTGELYKTVCLWHSTYMSIVVPPNIRTVIWDLDGTLLESFGVFRDILTAILPRHDQPVPTEAVFRDNFYGSLSESIQGCLTDPNEGLLDIVVQDFLDTQDAHYELIEQYLYQDALGLAKRFEGRGMHQIIVTNREHAGRLRASPRSIVERSELSAFIDVIICGDECTERKPNPAVLGTLVQDGTVDPADTLVVGDQLVDAELAANLGARGIVINRNGEPSAALIALRDRLDPLLHITESLDEVQV